MKNIIRIALVLSAFIVLPVGAYFSDVSLSHPNYNAISHVKTEGIVSGYPDGTYRPDSVINRAEFTKIVMEANFSTNTINMCNPTRTYSFSDAGKEDWYSKYLCSAVQNKIISGYDDGTFRPAASINFAEAAKIVATTDLIEKSIRYGKRLPPAGDGPWYEQYVQYLSDNNAVPASIKSNDKLITRGEMAEIIYRLQVDIGSIPGYCTDDPVGTAIGRDEYPKLVEYAHLDFLGELFTASECGQARIDRIFGVRDGMYTLKPKILLKDGPSNAVVGALDKIGFDCLVVNIATSSCVHWLLDDLVPVSEILTLEPYADEIRSVECTNCG